MPGMSDTMSLITARNLTIRLEGRTILHDVDFMIGEGEIVTVVGPNGSGKSTFMRALVGALSPARGSVTRRSGLRIGYVPQVLHIDRTLPLTVARFLSLPTGRSKSEITAALTETGIPPEVAAHQVAALSGGQFQRVLLARALLGDPHLLVLDEPTKGLDQPGVAAFYLLVEQVRRRLGCAVLMVSHDLHVVMSASDRVICINGHICCEGAPVVVSQAPEYRAMFGQGTRGALALYQHDHDHGHDHGHDHSHDNRPGHCGGDAP